MSKAIRLSINDEVQASLQVARRKYPALSDPEILKLGLSKVVTEPSHPHAHDTEKNHIQQLANVSVGYDYLRDPTEDIYTDVAE